MKKNIYIIILIAIIVITLVVVISFNKDEKIRNEKVINETANNEVVTDIEIGYFEPEITPSLLFNNMLSSERDELNEFVYSAESAGCFSDDRCYFYYCSNGDKKRIWIDYENNKVVTSNYQEPDDVFYYEENIGQFVSTLSHNKIKLDFGSVIYSDSDGKYLFVCELI